MNPSTWNRKKRSDCQAAERLKFKVEINGKVVEIKLSNIEIKVGPSWSKY